MKNSNNDRARKRYNMKMGIILFFVLLLGAACFIKILHLATFQRALYTGQSNRCLDKTKEGWEDSPLASDSTCDCYMVENNVRPIRGEIYDDQNRVLVSNVTVFDLTVDGREFSKQAEKEHISAEQKEKWIAELSLAFYNHFKSKFPKQDLEYYTNKFSLALSKGKNALVLQSTENNDKKWVTNIDTAFINQLPVFSQKHLKECVNYTYHTVRINPYGDLAKRTLGRYSDGVEYGMEYYFNDILGGVKGSRKYLYVNNARLPLDGFVEPIDGCDIHTTLNIEIQNIVHNELKNELIKRHATWGCAVIMETHTGEIKAICNLRRAGRDSTCYTESNEYVLHAMVEPGSTFKLASSLVYLNKTKGKDDKTYDMAYSVFSRTERNGTTRQYAKTDGHGNNTIKGYPIDIFQRSSNVGVASMIFDVCGINNYNDFLKSINDLYVTTSFATQLGKVQAPNFKTKARDFHTYYNTCYGAGFSMTPIQTLVYYNAVANNGKMIAPLFVKYTTRAHETDTLERFKAEVIKDKICSDAVIAKARKYMEAVVYGEHGTARAAQDPTFTFAGKTGTRDIWDEQLKQYVHYKNSASFCGYFPADQPKYTCLVFMYNVSCKGNVAAQIFANIAKSIMNMTNYAAMRTVNQGKGTILPRTNVVNAERYAFIMESLGINYPKDKLESPYVTSAWTNDYKVTVKDSKFKSSDKLPNVEQMIASDAVSELTRAGYKVYVVGYGVVKRQEYHKADHSVTLYLE